MASVDAPLIVPIFLPYAGCPHRCVFCNQESITGNRAQPLAHQTIKSRIDHFLKGCRPSSRRIQLAFYGGNFLGMAPEDVLSLLEMAAAYVKEGKIHGIRFSTRPDTIDSHRLDCLCAYPVDAVEIGAQSMNDEVLRLSRRGHTAEGTQQAVALLKSKGFVTGLQLMVGLPGDDERRAMASARSAAALSPDFVRIYPTVVLKESPLAKLYTSGRYISWTIERCVSIVKEMHGAFREKNIPVIRMGLQATVDLDSDACILAGPYHPAFGHLVISRIFLDKAVSTLKACAQLPEKAQRVTFCVHPRSVPRLRGQHNENIKKLKQMFGLVTVDVRSDPLLAEDDVKLTKV
ncbi:MAG: radical SAM protein [Desulfobacterales bacterium]|jgi:histone acetyltransferase (RNA polymerase elongator complex component)|nr:radical SAM protein [Desulfobacterales bacterium]